MDEPKPDLLGDLDLAPLTDEERARIESGEISPEEAEIVIETAYLQIF